MHNKRAYSTPASTYRIKSIQIKGIEQGMVRQKVNRLECLEGQVWNNDYILYIERVMGIQSCNIQWDNTSGKIIGKDKYDRFKIVITLTSQCLKCVGVVLHNKSCLNIMGNMVDADTATKLVYKEFKALENSVMTAHSMQQLYSKLGNLGLMVSNPDGVIDGAAMFIISDSVNAIYIELKVQVVWVTVKAGEI